MNVQELIDRLQKIEDKTQTVFSMDYEYGEIEVVQVHEKICDKTYGPVYEVGAGNPYVILE